MIILLITHTRGDEIQVGIFVLLLFLHGTDRKPWRLTAAEMFEAVSPFIPLLNVSWLRSFVVCSDKGLPVGLKR